MPYPKSGKYLKSVLSSSAKAACDEHIDATEVAVRKNKNRFLTETKLCFENAFEHYFNKHVERTATLGGLGAHDCSFPTGQEKFGHRVW